MRIPVLRRDGIGSRLSFPCLPLGEAPRGSGDDFGASPKGRQGKLSHDPALAWILPYRAPVLVRDLLPLQV